MENNMAVKNQKQTNKQKKNQNLPDPKIPLLGTYPKELKART